MPVFAEIANAHPNPFCSLRAQIPYHGKLSSVSFALGKDQSAWKCLDKLKRVNFDVGVGGVVLGRCRLLIEAVATTLEPKRLAAKEDEYLPSNDLDLDLSPNPSELLLESSNQESAELDEREKLRRMRISKANKGNTPWNKGRKHTAETLQKIRERTWLAMQNPKVKMKLANLGHAQTTETRQKISAGVRMRWERKREKKAVQETCSLEWQNLIAEASRQGYVGQEELQWNSYETLSEQLKLEWLESAKQRKQMPREPGSKRAPKTPEQRRKISEAISAKWADPEYRNRVCSAIIKHHGTEGTERKPRRRPSNAAHFTRKRPIMKKDAVTNVNVKSSSTNILKQIGLKKSKFPVYQDPLVSSKLEMIKSIRAQRAAAETKQTKAIEQAWILIAEAEKAAEALEVAATESPIAQASLMETRKLIAEAIQSLESIDTQGTTVSNVPSVASNNFNKEEDADFEVPNQSHKDPVNGHTALSSRDYKFSNDFSKFSLQKLVNGDSELHPTITNGRVSFPVGLNSEIEEISSSNQLKETEQDQSSEHKTDPSPTVLGIQSTKDETQPRSPIVTKKWVRGRLVEVVEEK